MLRNVAILALAVLVPWGLWNLLATEAQGPVSHETAVEQVEDEADVTAKSADADIDTETTDEAESDDDAVQPGDRVEVAPPQRERAIRGRLLVDGKAAKGVTSAVFMIRGPFGVANHETEVGSFGRFRVPILPRPTAGSFLRVVAEIGDKTYGATVALPDVPITAIDVEVGKVELIEYVLLAHGRVVDDVGVPVDGATVTATQVLRVSGDVFDGSGSVTIDSAMSPFSPGSEIEIDLQRFLVERERASRDIEILREQLAEAQAERIEVMMMENLARTAELSEIAHELNGLSIRYANVGRVAMPPSVASVRTDHEGKFELFGLPLAAPLAIRARAERHRPTEQQIATLGEWVDLTMTRTASLAGSALLPHWLPAHAVEFVLAREDGSQSRNGTGAGARAEFEFADVDPGDYTLVVRMLNLPGPVASIGPITLLPGPPVHDPRVHDIDLTNSVHRYRLRARDERGLLLTEIASPLLVRFPEGVRGFSWHDGRIEIFAAQPNLDLTLVNQGYKVEEVSVASGDTDLVFHALQPIEVLLPGLRAECGPDRKVRISMILQGSTGLPSGMEGINQLTGESTGYSRWHLSKSGGAWLEASDLVRVPLIRNGTYQIVIRLHEEGVSGDVSIGVGNHEVVLDDFQPHRIVVDVDLDQIKAGIEQLRARRGD